MLTNESVCIAENFEFVVRACWSNYKNAIAIVDDIELVPECSPEKWAILDGMLCDYRDDIDTLADFIGIRYSLRY